MYDQAYMCMDYLKGTNKLLVLQRNITTNKSTNIYMKENFTTYF